MKNYLKALLEEKGLEDLQLTIKGVDGELNYMGIDVVVEFILSLDKRIQKDIRNKLVMIDFRNGDVVDFFKYLAAGMVRI